jgi:enterobactin synthetase component D
MAIDPGTSGEPAHALHAAADGWYGTELATMGPVRRAAFLAGRRCAHAAIASCDPALEDTPLRIGDGGAPRWPAGLVGAITHSATIASAAAARACDARGIGLDIEPRMAAATAREVRSLVATGDEVSLTQGALALDEPSAVTLVFSAKESVYKCLYPLVRRYFDYRDADVIDVDAATHRCRVRLGAALDDTVVAGTVVEVRFRIDALHVHTAAVLTAGRRDA